MARLAVTTSGSEPEALEGRARAAAQRWALPYVARRRKEPLEKMLGGAADAFLVFEREAVALWDREGPLRWHPGLALLRLKRIEAGETDDTFARVADLREGDQVLDCTLGLAQDALVAARVVGPTGRVVGLEKSLALYAVVSEGLARYELGPKSARIEAVHADAAEFLKRAEPKSFDVVIFDPMFEKPRKAQPSFEVLRRWADYTPLSLETLEQARRVARRWVIVKAAKYSHELKRLGVDPFPTSRFSDVAWAREPAR